VMDCAVPTTLLALVAAGDPDWVGLTAGALGLAVLGVVGAFILGLLRQREDGRPVFRGDDDARTSAARKRGQGGRPPITSRLHRTGRPTRLTDFHDETEGDQPDGAGQTRSSRRPPELPAEVGGALVHQGLRSPLLLRVGVVVLLVGTTVAFVDLGFGSLFDIGVSVLAATQLIALGLAMILMRPAIVVDRDERSIGVGWHLGPLTADIHAHWGTGTFWVERNVRTRKNGKILKRFHVNFGDKTLLVVRNDQRAAVRVARKMAIFGGLGWEGVVDAPEPPRRRLFAGRHPLQATWFLCQIVLLAPIVLLFVLAMIDKVLGR
jgi:hypothetical protein